MGNRRIAGSGILIQGVEMSFHFLAKRFARLFAFVAVMGTALFAEAQTPPIVSAFFSPPAIAQGGSSTLVISIYNADSNLLTAGTIASYTYSPLVNAGTFSTYGCAGTVTATAGTSGMSLLGESLAGFTSCTIYIDLNPPAAGTYSTTFAAGAFTGLIVTTPVSNAAYGPSTLTVIPPIVVANTGDSGSGSLRAAITLSNQNCNVSGLTPTFNIPGAGPHIIKPITQLPAITCDGVVIDGYTQPGSSPNSSATGPNNAVIQIGIDGSACPACNGLILAPIGASRLAVPDPGNAAAKSLGGGAAIRGIAIYSFPGDGVVVSPSYSSGFLFGNYIGTNPGGAPLGNGGNGVNFTSGGGAVGGTSAGDYNVIANNGANGVFLKTNNIPILGNAIFLNAGRGIDLNGAAPTIDHCDVDGLQNYPVITSAVLSAGFLTITGTFVSVDGLTYHLGLFSNSPSDRASNRGGRSFLGSTPAATGTPPGSCATPWSVTVPYAGVAGDTITATATSPSNSTSWFSAETAVTLAPISCYTFDSIAAMGGGAVGGSSAVTMIAPPGSSVQLNAFCVGPAATFVWSTSQTGSSISVTAPAAGGSTRFTVTGTSANGQGTATVDVNGALAGTPLCTLTSSPAIPIPAATDTSPFTVTVTCSPAATSYTWSNSGSAQLQTGQGTATATYQLYSPNPGSGYTVALTPTNAAGQGPDATLIAWVDPLTVSPASLTFPATNVGSQSVAQSITINNSSNYYIAPISSFTTTGPFVFVNNCLGSIGPGTSCTVDVTFAPTVAGTGETGSAVLVYPFAGTQTRTVALSGNALATAPGAPTIGVATAGNGQATVTFTPPTNTGGVPITGYTVTSSPGNLTATGAGSPITITGLTNGATYTFTVTATNSVPLTGPASAASNAVTPVTLPGAPIIGTATGANAQATVSFSPPSSNGGSAILGYTATSSPGGFTASGAASPLAVTGLANGTSYTFTVTATNAVGTGPASAASNAVIPVTLPGAPIIGTATAGNTQATVNFSPPTSNGGSVITSYTATSSPGGFTATGAAAPLTVTGLTNGTTYTFTVTATNAVGPGPASAASNAVTPATIPGAPIIGTATGANAQATVSFSPPSSNGGSAITSYTATSSPGGFTATGASSPLTVSGLTNGTSYVFKVAATNAVGTGPLSAASNAVTPIAGIPSATVTPTTLSFAPQTVLTASPAQTVTLVNNGPGALAIASILTSGDFAFTTACPASLAALATCTISVTFTPLVTGARTGALTISSSASGSPNVVALSGTGQAVPFPDILVQPGVNEFSGQAIGTESAVQIITVNNTGTAPLTLGTIDTTLADFVIKPASVAAGRTCGTTLAPGASCDVAVAFHPTAEGIRDGQLRVVNDANGSATVRVVGRGIVTAPVRQLGMVGQLDFGSQAVGTTSAGQSLVITNNTASPVSITGLDASGDFSVSNACATVAANATCTVLVTFHPSALGTRAGAVTIHVLADSVPYTVTLSGTGVPNPLPAIRLSATALGFGNVIYGDHSTQGVTLSNIGTAPLAVLSIVESGNSDFMLSNACPATVAPGVTCNLGVTFAPHAIGARSGTITVNSNAAGSPHSVSLSGSGCRYFSPAAARFFLTSC